MKKAYLILIFVVSLVFFNAQSRSVLQIIDQKGEKYLPFAWEEVEWLKITDNGDKTMLSILGTNGNNEITMENSIITNCSTVPLIEINTEEKMEEIPDRDNYYSASIKIRGFDEYDDFEEKVQIKGRGNTSWTYWEKKPYRLKFEKKQNICDLNKAESFVLTSNYTDVSLMQNPIAAFLGKMLEVPYTHSYVPVDVIFNGSYRGSYLLTNKPGINSGSVDIDESVSVMWEMDKSFDEENQFKSPVYNLPVMLSDPDMTLERFEFWKQDFINMEKAVSEGNIEEWIDLDTYAKYRVVYSIMYNKEIGHPKSVKIWKTEGGKYQFGPIWDFDVALGYFFDDDLSYTDKEIHYDIWMTDWMLAIDKNEKSQQLIRYYFNKFIENEQSLWDFIDELERNIRPSAIRNNIKWKDRGDWEKNILQMKGWLKERIEILKDWWCD